MKRKHLLSASDKWFFGSMPVYMIFGMLDIWFKWFDPTFITLVWLLWLAVGVLYFRLKCK